MSQTHASPRSCKIKYKLGTRIKETMVENSTPKARDRSLQYSVAEYGPTPSPLKPRSPDEGTLS